MPEGWQIVRLGEVAEVNPRRPRLDVPDETPVVFLPMSAIAENFSGILTRDQRPYRDVAQGYTYFEEEDVLFSKITPCLQNGKHTLATGLNGGFGFGTTEFHVVRAGKWMAAQYLYRILTQAHVIEQCTRSFTGTAGQQRVQPDTLRALRILLPPLPEQRAIAAVLDVIDDAIEGAEAVIAATERLRDSLLHELLTRGMPGWHSEWKDAPGVGTVPAGWEVVRLGEVLKLEYGVSLPERDRLHGHVPVVGSAGPVGFHHQATNSGPGIVIGRKGSIGTVTWVSDDFVPIDTTYFAVPIDGQADLLWLYHLLAHEDLSKLNRATGVPGLNRDDVYALKRQVPPLAEQRAIAAVLDGVEDAVERGRVERDTLQSVKAATADALLTGRVRVGAEHESG